MSPDSNTGDGILAGERAHGEIAQDIRSPALWMPSSVMPQEDGHLSVFPHIMLDRAKPGLIAVNSAGVRFVNEANSYHDFVEGMLRSHRTTPSIPSFLICDRSFIRDYGLGLIHPGTRDLTRFIKSGYLFQGDSIAELAQANRRRWRRVGRHHRTAQSVCRDRRRRGFRPRHQRTQPLQRRYQPTSQTRACARSAPAPISPSRSGLPTSRAARACAPTPTAAC